MAEPAKVIAITSVAVTNGEVDGLAGLPGEALEGRPRAPDERETAQREAAQARELEPREEAVAFPPH